MGNFFVFALTGVMAGSCVMMYYYTPPFLLCLGAFLERKHAAKPRKLQLRYVRNDVGKIEGAQTVKCKP